MVTFVKAEINLKYLILLPLGGIKMSDNNIDLEVLGKNRAYRLKVGDVTFVALKLEGFKAASMGAEISQMGFGAGGGKTETNDWLIVVQDRNGVYPDDVWKHKAARMVANVSGTYVENITMANQFPENE